MSNKKVQYTQIMVHRIEQTINYWPPPIFGHLRINLRARYEDQSWLEFRYTPPLAVSRIWSQQLLPCLKCRRIMCVQKDRFPDKNLDCQTPTASDWKTNRKRSPVGTANTLMHQHYNDLQSSSSGLAVWVIFFAKDPPLLFGQHQFSFNAPGAHRNTLEF